MRTCFFRIFFMVWVAIGIMPANLPAYEAYIPHITSAANDWEDYLEIDNNGAASASVTLTLYGAGSQVYSGNVNVGGLSEQVINLKSLASTADFGVVTYSSTNLNLRLAYRNSTGGGVAEFRLSDDLSTVLGFYFSEISANIAWKGIALANPGSTSATAQLYAVGTGSVLGSTTVTIGPYSKITGMHSNYFPGLSFGSVKKIVAVSASNLCGIAISGSSDVSLLLFTSASEITGFDPGGVPGANLSGNWVGTWRSTAYPGESGQVNLNLTQSGSTVSGAVDLSNTDCGDISGAAITGTVSGNVISFNGSFNCSGSSATLVFTNGTVVGNAMAGPYQVNVEGVLYDQGTFTLYKQ